MAKSIDLSMTEILKADANESKEFDVDPLFTIVKKILNRASDVVQHVVMGNKLENMEEEPPTASLDISLCTLKHLYCEMACKPPGEEINAGKKILEELKDYSWDAKAVLTLAAFALDYGDFWLLVLAHIQASDKSAKWVGILKGVPIIVTDSWLQKHKLAIIQLDQLIKSTLDAIDCILQLEGLSDRYAQEDLPELSAAMYSIPLDVYYAIITVVACTTQMCCLINDKGETQELSSFSSKVNTTVESLNLVIKHTRKIIEKLEDYRKLVKIMNNPRKITVVFNEMRFTSLLKVDLKEIETKNVFLFFSDMDISENEISFLKSIDDNDSTKDQYRIIWIPIVDWKDDMAQKKFEEIQSKMPSTWYMLQNFSFDLGIQYIKEKWQFKNRPVVVVMNSQGMVVHRDAYHMIALGINPLLPITGVPESPLPNGEDSVGLFLLGSLHIDILTWMKQEKYIFFYGSKDTAWTKQFKDQLNALGPVYKPASFESFYVEDKGENTLWKFWNRFESFFLVWNNIKSFLLSETDKKTRSSTVVSTILNLLSFKTTKSTEWVILCKGSKLVGSGHGITVLEVLKKFDPPCPTPINTATFDFASSFLNYYREIIELPAEKRGCCHIDIAEDPGKITEVMCPVCPKRMKLSSSKFTCCHRGYVLP